jgi:hypothetical protein
MNLRPYTPEQLEEIENLAAEAELDPATARAHAAELLALRRLHETALHRRGRLSIELDRLPRTVGDVGHFKERIAASRQIAGHNGDGAADLVSLANT